MLITQSIINLGAKKPFQLVIFQGGSGETDTLKERDLFLKQQQVLLIKFMNPELKPRYI